MQDYWNDPPENDEMPEWYVTLEDVLENQDPPKTVADAIRRAMEEWLKEENIKHDQQSTHPENSEAEDAARFRWILKRVVNIELVENVGGDLDRFLIPCTREDIDREMLI